jgi:hypothetical protein
MTIQKYTAASSVEFLSMQVYTLEAENERLRNDCANWQENYDEQGRTLQAERQIRKDAEERSERLKAENEKLRRADDEYESLCENLQRIKAALPISEALGKELYDSLKWAMDTLGCLGVGYMPGDRALAKAEKIYG